MYRVLLTDYAWPDLDIERRILDDASAELIIAPSSDVDALSRIGADCDAIMTNWATVSKSVIATAERCRIIVRLGVGLDNIDVSEATARGIVVTNVPDYCSIEVAEHTVALLFALARKVAFFHHESKCNRYSLSEGRTMRRLEGQTLGVIGCGQIGQRVARKAMAMGLTVYMTAKRRKAPGELPAGAEWRDFDELLATSDFVSLHLPLTPDSYHIIGDRAISHMKPSAFLINTARGGLIDHDALSRALKANRIAGAAIDVQEPEPPNMTQAPFSDPRVVVTPHAAFMSRESLENLRSRAAKQVVACLTGRVPECVVNPIVLAPKT